MNLNQIRVFVAVANRLSFTLAAQDLHLTQPAVSLQIKALERNERIRLFERRGNVLGLTEAGRALYDSAVTMLSAHEQATRLLAELSGAKRGRLAIGTNTTSGMYVVPDVLARFHERWPDADIELHIDPAVRILERIHQNVVDIGIVGGPVEDDRFEVEHLAPDPLALIFSPRHPFAREKIVTLADLADQPFIVPEPTSVMRILFERALREAGLAIRIGQQLHEAEPVKKAVEANLGVGIVSALAISRELATGDLLSAPIEGLTISRHLEMVSRRDRYFSPVALRFREFVRKFFAGDPP
ncbi:MAG TPA: LysR substrate-binding domain-containing protein [Chloroflexota bacterium]|nr:LysR substrate-binding domain-containing protein [Chloroflexota bacterium]